MNVCALMHHVSYVGEGDGFRPVSEEEEGTTHSVIAN